MKLRDVWFGIVDGVRTWMAVMELQSEGPTDWARFQWKAICLDPGQDMPVLRHLIVSIYAGRYNITCNDT